MLENKTPWSLLYNLLIIAKFAPKQTFLYGNFTLFNSKSFQIWDHFFPLIFPQGFWISKIFWQPPLWRGGKKTFKWYLKKRTHTLTDKHMEKLTYRKHWPRGQMLWKSNIRETLNLSTDADSITIAMNPWREKKLIDGSISFLPSIFFRWGANIFFVGGSTFLLLFFGPLFFWREFQKIEGRG